MPQNNIKLVWDINRSRVNIYDIDIIVLPEKLATANVDALVEEQDTALILSRPDKITDSDNKPSWVLANQLESQNLYQPGSIIKRRGQPLRLLAIVHDFDNEPSWHSAWIKQALQNILNICKVDGLKSIRFPVLGAQYGRFELQAFLQLLVNALRKQTGALQEIYLIVPPEDCPQALLWIKELAKTINNND